MLTTLKCLIPFVSGLVEKDLCIFAVMGHAHPDTGEDQVRSLRKVNLSVWFGLETFILRYLKNLLKQSGTASNLTLQTEREEK